jgi:hypothetical protein
MPVCYVMVTHVAFFGRDQRRQAQSDSDQFFRFQHLDWRWPMHSTIAKRWTLCGVMASVVIIAAASSLTAMTGGCGPNETIVCAIKDAGADDGGQGGDATGSTSTSTSTSLCDEIF